MTRKAPEVSIGMPVFNGENYIREALDSLLCQTYSNFELIIADNASTDSTQQICEEYATRDSRIRYIRHPENFGAAANYNIVFERATGRYFKWAAHDDLCAPETLACCLAVLNRDPSVVLCHAQTAIVDEHSRPYLNYLVRLNTMSPKPHVRFGEMINKEHWCYQIFGLLRTEILRRTPCIASYTDSDRVLLAELCLWGRIYEVPKTLLFRREHPETSTRKYVTNAERMVWFDPKLSGRLHFPILRKFRGYLSAIRRAPLNPYERLLCYAEIGRLLTNKANLRLARTMGRRQDRSHLAVPVEGVEWQ